LGFIFFWKMLCIIINILTRTFHIKTIFFLLLPFGQGHLSFSVSHTCYTTTANFMPLDAVIKCQKSIFFAACVVLVVRDVLKQQ
jgi:hypothetical protein